ncbi:hypothetical protein MMC13_005101 [Lambiella insularis]|nr:hypothetical protein [Lambiella insularis]
MRFAYVLFCCSSGSASILPHLLPDLNRRANPASTKPQDLVVPASAKAFNSIALPKASQKLRQANKPTAVLRSTQVASSPSTPKPSQASGAITTSKQLTGSGSAITAKSPSDSGSTRQPTGSTPTTKALKASGSANPTAKGFVQKSLSSRSQAEYLDHELDNRSAKFFDELYSKPWGMIDEDLATSHQQSRLVAPRSPSQLLTIAPLNTVWQGFPNGFGQWDSLHMDMVVRAWNAAKDMTTHVVKSMEAITPGSPGFQLFQEQNPICKTTKAATAEYFNCYRTFIALSNLAYGQLFGADPENINTVLQRWQSLQNNLELLNANNRNNHPLYLSMSTVVMNSETGLDECRNGAQAFSISVELVKEFQGAPGVQPPTGAILLNFCDPFFHLDRMEDKLNKLLTDQAANKATICNIDNLDSAARVMLHEQTHFPWTIDTNFNGVPPDRRGFMPVIRYNTAETGLQRLSTKYFGSRNADTYAWQGVSVLSPCQGVTYTGVNHHPDSCTDVYPKSQTKKWVQYQWNNYPLGQNN